MVAAPFSVSLVTVISTISMTGAVLVSKDPTTTSVVAGVTPAVMPAASETPE